MRSLALVASGLVLMAGVSPAIARTVRVPMALVTANGPGASVGQVIVRDSKNGLVLRLRLHGLPPSGIGSG